MLTAATDKLVPTTIPDDKVVQNKLMMESTNTNNTMSNKLEDIPGIRFVDYVDESQLDHVMSLVGRDLSEPYSSE